ncbi:MAG: cytochrome c oxidase subunit 3 [Planctomycetota bacterium]
MTKILAQPPIREVEEDRRLLQGALLFLVSLAVFFVACMILYAIYVLIRIKPLTEDAIGGIQPFYLPASFLITTVNLVAISILLHLAVAAVRKEARTDFNRYVILAAILAMVFFVIQGSGLTWMVDAMNKPTPAMKTLYTFTIFLVIVHALHVIGGAVGMVILVFGIRRQSYDHERHFPVRFCALYWHFLDFVWVIMMAGFALAAYVSKASG